MATEAWPLAVLPAYPLQAGYKLGEATGIVRTSMDDGLARQRRKYPDMPATLRVGWILNADRMSFFRGWIAHKAQFGAVWFSVTLDVGNGVETVEARFVGDPEYQRLRKGLWMVSAELEVLAPPTMDAGAVDVIAAYGFADVRAMAAAVEGVRLLAAFEDWDADFGVA